MQPVAYPFPAFDLTRLMRTIFDPKKGEKVCVLIDLEDPRDVVDFAFLQNTSLTIQKHAYEIFYQGMHKEIMQTFELAGCDFYAYKVTGGSNLELPEIAITPDGSSVSLEADIYPSYDIILCITTHSATAPLTAAAKKHKFRGATMHGLNQTILKTGLSVDYEKVSCATEKLRQGMTHADHIQIDFALDNLNYYLHIELGSQEAQKSHGICRESPDIVNLPAGEVYFVPIDAQGSFPIKFEEGTLAVMHVEQKRIHKITLLSGDQNMVDELQKKLDQDPATGILGELGFGTQKLPHSGSDIQDEKIAGTFHLAIGRNDHLNGSVTLDRFVHAGNATHEDILFSSHKTPEILVKQVRMKRHNRIEVLIENYKPSLYLENLLQ